MAYGTLALALWHMALRHMAYSIRRSGIGTLAHGTLRQRGNEAARQQGSKAIRQKAKGNKAIRQQGSKAMRQQGSKALRQQGSKASGHLLSTQPAAQISCKCLLLIERLPTSTLQC